MTEVYKKHSPSVAVLIPCQQMYIRAHLLAASFCKAKTSQMYGTTDIPVRSDTLRICSSNVLLLAKLASLSGNAA